jgi:hypothetical protein
MIFTLVGDSCPFANTLALAFHLESMAYAYFGAKEIDDRKLTATSVEPGLICGCGGPIERSTSHVVVRG